MRVDISVRHETNPAWNGSSGLEQGHFAQIAHQGFGDALNAYAHTMAWFRGKLYVGTTRANLCLLRTSLRLPTHCWPIPCPDDVYQLDLRAQIWRYDPQTQRWQLVHISPMILGNKGEWVPREIGYRGMTLFQGLGDSAPALYVATWAPSRAQGPLILRSSDGEQFVPISAPRLGVSISAFRSLVASDRRLYIAPTGRSGGQANTSLNPVVLESVRPEQGVWALASPPGFGDLSNLTVFEMCLFNGYLYAGTLNAKTGYQIWKTRAQGMPPYTWTQVISQGAYRGPTNEAVVSMHVFRNALYVGSGIQNGGYDRTYNVGPAAPELIRLFPDDSWELIVGESRSTPDGFKSPKSGFGPGFDNPANGYFWRMASLDGWLYLGTFKWTVLLPYLPALHPSSQVQALVRWQGIDNVVHFDGGFDLWRSQDGVRWEPVTTNGFGNPYNYGVRTMVRTPWGLFVGTANPFGPHVAIPTSSGWTYVPNPRGGAEVWLGAARTPDNRGHT